MDALTEELKEQCYPCGASGRPCVQGEQWRSVCWLRRRRTDPAVLPYVESSCRWYDVALWLSSNVLALPVCISFVEAVDAFAAVEQLMRAHGLLRVAVASARALDGSIVYRAAGVKLRRVDDGARLQREEYLRESEVIYE